MALLGAEPIFTIHAELAAVMNLTLAIARDIREARAVRLDVFEAE
jgi:hypothetical protein